MDEKAELRKSVERIRDTLGKEYGDAIAWAYRVGLIRKGPEPDVDKLPMPKKPGRRVVAGLVEGNGHLGKQPGESANGLGQEASGLVDAGEERSGGV